MVDTAAKNRTTALLVGSSRYQGSSCERGHDGIRYVSNKNCVTCARIKYEARRAGSRLPPLPLKPRTAAPTLDRSRDVAPYYTCALLAGFNYYHGRPCAADHSVRHTSSRSCVQCAAAASAQRRAQNPGESLEYDRAWRARNPEKAYEKTRRWGDKNHDKVREYDRHYRARKRGALGKHTAGEVAAVLKEQGGCCAYCRSNEDLAVDHKNPLCRGGANDQSNLQWLCRSCNSSKGSRTDQEYRLLKGIPPAGVMVEVARG